MKMTWDIVRAQARNYARRRTPLRITEALSR
jgi:hypothetical protein